MMKTVHAIFENGVFRPTGPVELPERCEVEFEPRPLNGNGSDADEDDEVLRILGERYDSGETDVSERHNEHQP
jgi:predicted DNA-binding antitoxin AbrB/MazE fold protein